MCIDYTAAYHVVVSKICNLYYSPNKYVYTNSMGCFELFLFVVVAINFIVDVPCIIGIVVLLCRRCRRFNGKKMVKIEFYTYVKL